jgi:hypothetical protein
LWKYHPNQVLKVVTPLAVWHSDGRSILYSKTPNFGPQPASRIAKKTPAMSYRLESWPAAGLTDNSAVPHRKTIRRTA